MKKVTIWDMDFYYKKSFLPNPVAMKISSFHKQEGDLINFVEEDYHINMSFDVYYIIKEKSSTPKPPGKLLDDKRVRLIGRPLRFFDGYWEVTPIISAVRPDYQLYPEVEKDAYYNANIIQFYHNGKLLPAKQPFENTFKYHKKTLVIDKEFWDVAVENIVSCLQELENYKNIAFLHPIDIKKILNSSIIYQSFLKLDFSPATIFRFRNNFGQEYEDAIKIFKFITDLKEINPHVKFTNMPFKTVTGDHWESKEHALYDLERCLQIADAAKERGVYIRLVSPQERFETPYWYYFELLEYWTLNLPTLSYVEMMLSSAMKKTKLQWNQILNNSIHWSTPNLNLLLALMTKTNIVDKFGFRRWKDDILDKKQINYKEISKFNGITDLKSSSEKDSMEEN